MDWEFYILNYIQQNFRNDFLDMAMPFISFIGNGYLWFLAAIVCFLIKKTRPFGRTLAINLALCVISCSFILKPIVQRIRPYDLNSTVSLIVDAETDYSFPSGHTFLAFSTATIIFMYNKALGTAAYIFASIIAFSRLYLYVHFPTDVICGAVFGILIAVAAYRIDKMTFPNKLQVHEPKYKRSL